MENNFDFADLAAIFPIVAHRLIFPYSH